MGGLGRTGGGRCRYVIDLLRLVVWSKTLFERCRVMLEAVCYEPPMSLLWRDRGFSFVVRVALGWPKTNRRFSAL